ncbi:MAG: type II toxin-antitoxin system HicA family toxin [Cyanobacteriota bacterium]|nr:type II toxin-antitoxin system HicA family toxin [Cyanobacteriota bacterium]
MPQFLYSLTLLGAKISCVYPGSHVIMKKQLSDNNTQIGCVVPLHNKTLAVGTLKSILNQANVSVDEFIQVL